MKRNGLLFVALLLLSVFSLCFFTSCEKPHEHYSDASGFCSICGLPMSATEGLIIEVSSDCTYAEVVGYSGVFTRVNIPSTYSNLPVKSICAEVFKNKNNISKVIIPDSVTSIGDYAFFDCYSLTSIEIPDSVTSIGDYAFTCCYSLTSVTIGNSVTSIGDDAFYRCVSLTSIVIPDSVTSIGIQAFAYCDSLTSVTIPDSVTSIADWTFYGCESLQYYIEGNLKYLGNTNNPYLYLADVASTSITNATINENCKIIGSDAFSGCDSLTSVTIPDSVTSIGYYAFAYCDSLTSVTFSDTSTWYRIFRFGYNAYDNWQNKTGGTEIDVTDASNNAGYFKLTYINYYWYKI